MERGCDTAMELKCNSKLSEGTSGNPEMALCILYGRHRSMAERRRNHGLELLSLIIRKGYSVSLPPRNRCTNISGHSC